MVQGVTCEGSQAPLGVLNNVTIALVLLILYNGEPHAYSDTELASWCRRHPSWGWLGRRRTYSERGLVHGAASGHFFELGRITFPSWAKRWTASLKARHGVPGHVAGEPG